MQQRQVPRYRSVEYQPPTRADVVSTSRHPVQRLDRRTRASKQYSQPLNQTPDYVPLFDDDEERPHYEGPILKKRATRTQDVGRTTTTTTPNKNGRTGGDWPVERVETKRPNLAWVSWLFIGAGIFLLLYLAAIQAIGWVNRTIDHYQYGASPVYHMTAYVGINDSPSNPSDFYCEISHNQVVITQVTSSKVTTYPLVWQGSDIDGYIPTLSTSKDTSTGRIDVLVKVGSMSVTMYNTGQGFSGQKP